MFTENTLTEVRSADIVSVISPLLKLKKAGRNYTASCPFHKEKSGSFTVFPLTNSFKCFGCGAGGDVVAFVMRYQNLEFTEAVEYIADATGITLEKEAGYNPEAAAAFKAQTASVFQVLNKAQQNLVTALEAHPEAKKYLAGRGWDDETLAQWGIGWAPGRNTLLSLFAKEDLHTAVKAGILAENDEKFYDFFRERITFPIHNAQGQIVSFTARTLGAAKPKYINGPATDIFQKDKILYGLHLAASHIRAAGMAILVEGNPDVISLHQASCRVAVATCGTALTESHIKTLKRYTNNVCILADADAAGMAAAEKAVPALLAGGIEMVEIMPIPTGPEGEKADPDTWVRSLPEETDALEEIIRKKEDAVVWLLHKWRALAGTAPIQLSQFADKAAGLLCNIKDALRRDTYTEFIGSNKKTFSITRASLKSAISRKIEAAADAEGEEVASESSGLPKWMNLEDLEMRGFCAVEELPHVGYWTRGERGGKLRISNFTINPIFHVAGKGEDSRHIIEIKNGTRTAVVDVKSKALISLDTLQTEIVAEGNFVFFGSKSHLLNVAAELLPHFPLCHEIRQPGWQPEGFYAYLNRVVVPGSPDIVPDQYGVFEHNEQHYLIPAASVVYAGMRVGEERFQVVRSGKHIATKVTFKMWAAHMQVVYKEKGLIAVAYALLSAFRDFIFALNGNCPHLYLYGERSSGKSQLGESICAAFTHARPAFNLNQGTDFAFFAYVGAFRNAPARLNEFDDKVVADDRFQSLKGMFDGEGRMRGKMGGGRTDVEIQSVDSTIILMGQFISTKDDNSIVSRSIVLPFAEQQYTTKEKKDFDKLRSWQEAGLTALAGEVVQHRHLIEEKYPDVYSGVLASWRHATPGEFNQRIMQNWGHLSALWQVLGEALSLPAKHAEFDQYCYEQALKSSAFIRSSDTLTSFWNTVEALIDARLMEPGWHFKVKDRLDITVRDGEGKEVKRTFSEPRKVLYVRLDLVHGLYQKMYRERHSEPGMTFENLKHYLATRPYFLGHEKSQRFKRIVNKQHQVTQTTSTGNVAGFVTRLDKEEQVTSAYAFDYALLDRNLETEAPEDGPAPAENF